MNTRNSIRTLALIIAMIMFVLTFSACDFFFYEETITEEVKVTATPTNTDAVVTPTNGEPTAKSDATPTSGATSQPTSQPTATASPSSDPLVKSNYTGYLTAKSDTGLDIVIPQNKTTTKEVGIFYFIWHGATSSGGKNLDDTEILKNFTLPVSGSGILLSDWQAAGGGGKGAAHYWGKPLLGYYDAADEWVIERHLMMFMDAGIDYIIIDQTNGVLDGYLQRIKVLFRVFYKYQQQGYNVPKIAMMCYDDGPSTVNTLYTQIYKKNSQWASLFYHWNNHSKPVIFDNIASYNKQATSMINTTTKLASYVSGVTDFFEIRDVAFPHETQNGNSNFSEGKSLIYLDVRSTQKKCVDKSDGNYAWANVAVSVIRGGRSSRQWTGNNSDYTRSWDGTKNRNWYGETDAYLYGYNFEREFMNAINQGVSNIFITGWNEWIAQLIVYNDGTVGLYDNCDINNSRDIEPMSSGYGDNYYLQMCKLISLFKYGTTSVTKSDSKTIDINGSFSQWNDANIPAYNDLTGDNIARNNVSAGDQMVVYKADAAKNDFTVVKMTSDSSNLYFYAKTSENIKDFLSKDQMVLLLSTKGKTQFDFVINRTTQSGQGSGKVLIESLNSNYSVKSVVGEAEYKLSGSEVMIKVPRSLLGIGTSTTIGVKWVDSVDITGGWEMFYQGGEMAPYGRLAYAFK